MVQVAAISVLCCVTCLVAYPTLARGAATPFLPPLACAEQLQLWSWKCGGALGCTQRLRKRQGSPFSYVPVKQPGPALRKGGGQPDEVGMTWPCARSCVLILPAARCELAFCLRNCAWLRPSWKRGEHSLLNLTELGLSFNTTPKRVPSIYTSIDPI